MSKDEKTYPKVFVSHSGEDGDRVKAIYEALAKQEVDVWASFKDIPPGAEWDQSIQKALEASSHVLVIVSRASVRSSYVRAEVEYALDKGRVVIPILLDIMVELPLRWRTLQYVIVPQVYVPVDRPDWIEDLAKSLPRRFLAQLQFAIDNSGHFEELRDLLYDKWSLIDMRAMASTRKEWLAKKLPSDKLGMADIGVLYRVGSDGSSILNLVYFASPYHPPFELDGQLTREVQEYVEDAKRFINPQIHISNIAFLWPRLLAYISDDSSNHLGDIRLFSMTITIYAGRRMHYDDQINGYRIKLQDEWLNIQYSQSDSEDVLSYMNRYLVSLSLASYDRLASEFSYLFDRGM